MLEQRDIKQSMKLKDVVLFAGMRIGLCGICVNEDKQLVVIWMSVDVIVTNRII